MRPGHRPPRDKRYFHTQKKYSGINRAQLNAKSNALNKLQQRHALKAQLKACRNKRR